MCSLKCSLGEVAKASWRHLRKKMLHTCNIFQGEDFFEWYNEVAIKKIEGRQTWMIVNFFIEFHFILNTIDIITCLLNKVPFCYTKNYNAWKKYWPVLQIPRTSCYAPLFYWYSYQYETEAQSLLFIAPYTAISQIGPYIWNLFL